MQTSGFMTLYSSAGTDSAVVQMLQQTYCHYIVFMDSSQVTVSFMSGFLDSTMVSCVIIVRL